MGSTHRKNAPKQPRLPVSSEEIAAEIAAAYMDAQVARTAGMVRVTDLALALNRNSCSLTRKLAKLGAKIVHLPEYGQSGVTYVSVEDARRIIGAQ